MTVADSKAAWRAELLAARRQLSPSTRVAEARLIARWVARWALGRDRSDGSVVCAYVPVDAEPGAGAMIGALDMVVEAGYTVLLPVVVRGEPLDWAAYAGADALAPAGFGLLEPTGRRLGTAAVGDAAALLVPALAVDRRGIRLGHGAGYYDRTLAHVRAGVELVAVVRDAELVDELPREPHDVPVTAVLTPAAGILALPQDVQT